jgi:hypothetical protein
MTRTRMAGWGDGWCSGSWDNALPLSEPQWDVEGFWVTWSFGLRGGLRATRHGAANFCFFRLLRTQRFRRSFSKVLSHTIFWWSFLVNALEWMLKRNITVALTSNFPAMGQRDWHNVWNSCMVITWGNWVALHISCFGAFPIGNDSKYCLQACLCGLYSVGLWTSVISVASFAGNGVRRFQPNYGFCRASTSLGAAALVRNQMLRNRSQFWGVPSYLWWVRFLWLRRLYRWVQSPWCLWWWNLIFQSNSTKLFKPFFSWVFSFPVSPYWIRNV